MRSALAMSSVMTLLLAATQSMAHHSYAAFDKNKIVTVKGAVYAWEMGNPHGYLWVIVKDPQGSSHTWGLESPSPSVLLRQGWSKYSVKVGDVVTVELNPLRDGRNGGSLLQLQLADGRVLSTGPLPGAGAPK
jgi:hypothetical protein